MNGNEELGLPEISGKISEQIVVQNNQRRATYAAIYIILLDETC